MITCLSTLSLPSANEVWGKVVFSQACVIPFIHGGGGGAGFPACITGHMIRKGVFL